MAVQFCYFFIDFPFCEISWQPDSKFAYSQLRLPMETDAKVEFTENQEVEVYSRADSQEANGWWRARIKVKFVVNIFMRSV